MADIIQRAHVDLSINAKAAEKVLDGQRKKVEELKKKYTELVNSNADPKILKNLEKEVKRSEKQLERMEVRAKEVTGVIKRMDKASLSELNKALTAAKSNLSQLERGSQAWKIQAELVRRLKAEIGSLNAEMSLSQSKWERFNGFINKFQTMILGITGALTGLILAGKKAVSEFAQMDEAMANTRKFTGLTEEGVRELNDEFIKMDTRTAREKLNDLAQEAGRLGKTSKEDIMGYVKAADILNVALSDLGEGATGKIAKLSNIFGVEETEGTYNAMVKIGSTINVLSQNCTASKPYLVEFTNRLAGVGNQANMSIPQIVGLGAVLDSNAQKVEASATAIAQVLTRMYVDPAKYASKAGLDVKNFTELLKTDANEALLQFLTALNQAGNMDALAPMFKDMGETGARAIAAMSTLAKHIDEVRWQQQNANKAFEEGTSVLHEYNIFNNTAQAGLDKAKKRVSELCIQLGEKLMPIMKYFHSSSRIALEVLSKIVDFVKDYGKEIMVVCAGIAAYSVAVNLATIRTKAFAAAQTIANAGIVTVKASLLLLNAAYGLLTGNITRARAAMQLFNATVKANPVGLLIAAITAAVTAFVAFTDKSRQAKEDLENYKKEIRDIDKASADYAKQEVTRLERLYKVATDEKKSRDARIGAIKDMQKLYPQVFENLDMEAIMVGKAKDQYDKLRDSIINAAKARAAEEKIEKNSGDLIELESRMKQLKEDEKKLVSDRKKAVDEFNRMQSSSINANSNNGFNASYFNSNLSDIDKALKANRKEQKENALQTELLTKANKEMYDSYVAVAQATKIAGDNEEEESQVSSHSAPALSEKEKKAAAKKAAEDFNQGLKNIKNEETDALNASLTLYATGQINYLEYIEQKRQAEEKFYEDSLKFYEEHLSAIKGYDVKDDKDYQDLQLKKTQAMQKYESQRISFSAERIRKQSQWEQLELEESLKWKENKTVIDEIALQEQLLEIRIKYLRQEQKLHAEGSKEWEDLELKIQDTVENARFDKEKALQNARNEMLKQFDKLTVKELYEQKKKVLDYLLEVKQITIEQYKDMMRQLDAEEKKAAKNEKDKLPGADYRRTPKERAQMNEDDYNGKKSKLDKALEDGMVSAEEYDRMLYSLQEKFRNNALEGLRNCKDEWVVMLTNMGEAWVNLFKDIEGGGDWLSSLEAAMQAAVVVMGAVFQQISKYSEAQMQIQVKAVENRYDKEIEAAQGNNRLVTALEKKKEKEIAKIKEEASRKNFEMQVIAALAQTATNAVSAYGAGLKVGGAAGLIIAPIAAATAVAAGMVQVAAIKKQQEAAKATGYAEGGYTPEGGKYDVAGVVHKGEWVASQKLLRSPVTAPVISLLDKAQKSNTMASLSLADSNYFAGAISSMPAPAAKSQPPQVVVNVPESDNPQVLQNLVSVIGELTKRLNDPFVTVNTFNGPAGIKKAQDDFNRYNRNRLK